MDICTFSQFRDSLNAPQTLLRTQHNAIFEPDTLCCNKHFAEARATIDRSPVMLYAPITLQAAEIAHNAICCIEPYVEYFADMCILPKEILYSGLVSGRCCMIKETIPSGIPLSEAIYTLSRLHLLKGLNSLKTHLKMYNLSHNYLNIYNIIVDGNHRWHTIRNLYITHGYGNDIAILQELEQCINQTALHESTTLNEQLHLYSVVKSSRNVTLYPIKESRRRFETPNGIGFKDRNDNTIIEDIYSWASDFEEERAVVRLKDGNMGIIDRQGKYIIQPIYTNIEYDSYTGITTAYNGMLCTKFNYLGEEI